MEMDIDSVAWKIRILRQMADALESGLEDGSGIKVSARYHIKTKTQQTIGLFFPRETHHESLTERVEIEISGKMNISPGTP